MPLVKCEYCGERVPPNQLQLHLKRCLNYRRLQKKNFAPVDEVIQAEIEKEVVATPVKTKKKN